MQVRASKTDRRLERYEQKLENAKMRICVLRGTSCSTVSGSYRAPCIAEVYTGSPQDSAGLLDC